MQTGSSPAAKWHIPNLQCSGPVYRTQKRDCFVFSHDCHVFFLKENSADEGDLSVADWVLKRIETDLRGLFLFRFPIGRNHDDFRFDFGCFAVGHLNCVIYFDLFTFNSLCLFVYMAPLIEREFPDPRKLPHASLSKDNHYFYFCSHRLVLPALALCIKTEIFEPNFLRAVYYF